MFINDNRYKDNHLHIFTLFDTFKNFKICPNLNSTNRNKL